MLISVNCAVLSMSLAAALALSAAAPPDYSADMVMMSGAQVMQTSKINVSGQKSRFEGAFMGRTQISIARRDRGVVWSLHPDSKTYTERPLTEQAMQVGLGEMPGEVKREKIGSAQAAGYACTKYLVTYTLPRVGRQSTATLYIADSLGLPVRMEAEKMVTEYRNIKVGPQPAGLFEIPAGYTKSETPPLPAGKSIQDILKKMPRQ